MDRIFVVYNPASGRPRRHRLEQVLDRLAERDFSVQVEETRAGGDARRIAAALPEDTDMLVIAGGDGTINDVLNGLAENRHGDDDYPELALLPMGTANVLAVEIGLTDLSPGTIAKTIVDGRRRDLYLARADGHFFAQMCGVGFDAHVVANVDVRLKRRLHKLAYVVASLAEIWRYVPRMYRVIADGNNYEAASVVVANGRFYAGRFTCAPQARVDEARLHVCLFTRPGRWNVIRYSWGVLSGRLGRFADVRVVPAENIVIESTRSEAEPVQGDGDIIGALPIAILAGAARFTMRCPV